MVFVPHEPIQKIPFPRELVVAIRGETFKAQPRGQVAQSNQARTLRTRLALGGDNAENDGENHRADKQNDERNFRRTEGRGHHAFWVKRYSGRRDRISTSRCRLNSICSTESRVLNASAITSFSISMLKSRFASR